MLRRALVAGLLLAGGSAAAQDSGGANVRFEQLANSLNIRAKIYKDDGDFTVETGEILTSQVYTAAQGGGIPIGAFTIVTVCALDLPGTSSCPPAQQISTFSSGSTLPRFFVDKADGIGVKSLADGTTASQKRINRLVAASSPPASAERMNLVFNCTNALCGPSITSGRMIFNKVDGTPRTILFYPILVAGGVGDPITVAVGGTNPAGITATLSSGRATVNLGAEVFANLPPIMGFQIGAGSTNARFTFRQADMAFAQPQPDFVDFGCRIDLAQTNVSDNFKTILAASSSEKFCPANNDGKLKLGCSGTIPDYSGDAASALQDAKCLISGSQCGIDAVLEAEVISIEVAAGTGAVELECETAPLQ